MHIHREIRCRMCNQARQMAADLRWMSGMKPKKRKEVEREGECREFENRVKRSVVRRCTVVSVHVRIGARTVAAHVAELVHSQHSRE